MGMTMKVEGLGYCILLFMSLLLSWNFCEGEYIEREREIEEEYTTLYCQ